MLTTEELQFVADRLSKSPFSKQLSVFQLHDQLTGFDLIQLVHEIFLYIDQQNPTSVHRIDLRNEPPEETVYRFGEFLKTLKFRLQDESQ
jgi:intraflagellar transport protein 81